ncbi:hypothetical protein AS034_01810 [[Bacillus] enclensis]|uniref:RES domain-containing protein n=1 Tax=[Bacillus] enclensis TaxID=1402860 RepID=A0A0V8HPS5_9BACI|nr:hypothetical protein [[Bacillus] enclensis]KSU64597.1 hypothetical protein AS034_01810 [[Bacillus] enclensis]SCB76856.1 hypothetical protein GA0061094_0376 [[Bacillus] enclensis]
MDKCVEYLEENMKLPLTYEGDFFNYISNYLEGYRIAVEQLEHNLGSDTTAKIKTVSYAVSNAVLEYFKGNPASAYHDFSDVLNDIEKELTGLNIAESSLTYFRIRENNGGSSHNFTRGEMFHIPFELRSLVSTQRFSIPGLPSIYLGSTLYVCWEEMNRPNFKNLNCSMYKSRKTLTLIDLGIPPLFIAKYCDQKLKKGENALVENILKTYFLLWPLIAASSVKVNKKNHPFKPEYIIPQLLLQYVTNEKEFDGIRYLSVNTSYSPNNYLLHHNYVFPAKTVEEEGHCKELLDYFELTPGIPWQFFEIHNSQGLPSGEEYTHEKQLEIEGVPSIQYGKTDFGKFERFLSSVVSVGKVNS